mgnify:CR=1 FL=1
MRRIALFFALAPIAFFASARDDGKAAALPTGQSLPYMGDPAPAQLRVLAPLLGDWSINTRVRTAEAPEQELHFAGQATGRLAYNGQFLRLEGSASDGKEREEYVVLYRYDPARASYRRWYFSSVGIASEFEGHWNAETKTMTWTLLNPAAGRSGTLTDTFHADGYTTDVVYKDGAGKIVRHATLEAVRKPAQAR